MLMGEDIEEDRDFIIEEKDKNVHLNAYGVDEVENLADPENK